MQKHINTVYINRCDTVTRLTVHTRWVATNLKAATTHPQHECIRFADVTPEGQPTTPYNPDLPIPFYLSVSFGGFMTRTFYTVFCTSASIR